MAKFAMLLLHARAPTIFPGMPLLAADMGTSVRTAQRAVRELERAGYVKAERRINQTNRYSITVPGATPPQVTHDPPPVSVTPPPCQCDTPPVTPMSPPHDTHVTTPVTPMSPEVSREVCNISNKRERESKRARSTVNHILKETLTCPKCERSWPSAYGGICHDCNMEVSTIQRNIETRKREEEAWRATRQKREDAQIKELEINRQKQDAQREEAKTCTEKQKAEQPEEPAGEVEAEIQKNRKELFDVIKKPYDAEILKHFYPGGEQRAVARAC